MEGVEWRASGVMLEQEKTRIIIMLVLNDNDVYTNHTRAVDNSIDMLVDAYISMSWISRWVSFNVDQVDVVIMTQVTVPEWQWVDNSSTMSIVGSWDAHNNSCDLIIHDLVS